MKTSSVYTLGDGTQWAAEQPDVDLIPEIIQIILISKVNLAKKRPKLFMEFISKEYVLNQTSGIYTY